MATRSAAADLPKPKPIHEMPNHRLFLEFAVGNLDELVCQLETAGQGIDVFVLEGVPHLTCGKPLSNILVQTDAVKNAPGDLLAIYQYCQGCRIAVRVL